ncbi:SDR family oxidoreductase [Rhodococcus sp. NBC_00294]|uniref:SDR family oxidoreductase n=1 Tax=Rhodococcus sp. NBC_00294 TaxID=2976004 RepID=UPI002E287494|nr:SDR family oxidoreductase [Rhodococcus sp. NBC_00294]
MTTLVDKTVLVTGGRRGLGAALVDGALERGARMVHSTARSPYTDERDTVVTHVLDVRSHESVNSLAAGLGDVDIVINNAGVLLPAPLLTGAFDDVVDTFEVNTFGPLRVVRAFAPVLAARGGGAVVNVHSVLSWLAGSGAYGASKAAIWSVTNSLRSELAGQHTHVLGVHAGFIDTEMVTDVDLPKTSPSVIADRVLDALEAGDAEVLADQVSVSVKAMLGGPVEHLAFDRAH